MRGIVQFGCDLYSFVLKNTSLRKKKLLLSPIKNLIYFFLIYMIMQSGTYHSPISEDKGLELNSQQVHLLMSYKLVRMSL